MLAAARMEPSVDDAELVRRYLEHQDPELFASLVSRYKDRAFRLVASILGPGSEPDAEEVVQEVFLTVYRELPRFRMESRFGTWLYRIAYNRAIDRKRTPRLRRPHVTEEGLARRPAAGGNPFASAADRERSEAVAA